MKSSRRDTISINDNVSSVLKAMQSIGADAVVLTNKPPIIYTGGEERYRALERLFGFSDDAAACLFYKGQAYFVTDSRYEIECKGKFAGVENLKLTITSDDPEDSCYLSVARKADEARNAKLVLAVNERTVHSRLYLTGIKGNDKVRIKEIDLFTWLFQDAPEPRVYSVDDVENLGFPNSFNKIFSPRISKLNAIMAGFKTEDPGGFLIFSRPSDIAWILNIRSFDNCPSMLPPSILVLSQEKGYLFVQGDLGNKLAYEFMNLRNNDEERSLVSRISVFTLDDFFNKAKYLIPVSSTIFFADLNYPAEMLSIFSPENYNCKAYDRFWLDKLMTVRTVEELESIRLAFRYDSIAYARLACMLHQSYRIGDSSLSTESAISDALLEIRKKNKYFICDSFPTISAFGPNGAICHYVPNRENPKKITEGLLVLDFGSQYDFGTTDNTRTISFGKPTDEERTGYTVVLKAHIKLQMIDFPFGTDGYRIDFLARSVLLEYGMQVPHGIGHGIEMIGNVHAAFPRLSSSTRDNFSLFKIYPGMVFTVEPGIYIEGKFGVRIENSVISVASEGKPGFMRFEPLTLMPYDLNLIDRSMLTEKEIEFINDYHKKVYNALQGDIDENDRSWLENLTRSI